MHRLSSIILFVVGSFSIWAQNPHGENFKVDCASCHDPNGWAISIDTFQFNHDTTSFPLTGRHLEIDCKTCHISLVFEHAPSDCISCHTDIHQTSVGTDCARCHNSNDWLVFDLPQLHESNGFPLTGAHQGLFCVDCHQADNPLRFDPIGNDCINCHQVDFDSAENPDHSDFSTNCIECHDPDFNGWGSENFNHSFFPLTLGHDIQDCKECHATDNFSDASPDCISCHQVDFDNTINPNHQASGISTDCMICHTTDPGWKPAEFRDHDNLYFPIYSGSHEGEWNDCIDCHTDPNNYSIFTCISCHINPETDDNHQGILGYVYQDNACLACHPTGEKDDVFDHDATGFSLTGAHLDVDCLQCHSSGFEGTPTDCAACHQMDHTTAVNPSHINLGLSNDCAACHTTEPDWMPATFDIHGDFYPLNGAHALIANDCVTCHNGDYNNTPNTCVGCHQADYDNAMNPNHQASGFGTDCIECHSEDSWTPAMFDHDLQYFPIYSGSHEGEWNDCVDCHINPGNFAIFTCIGCHLNPETDDEHMGVGGYVYEDNACLACHPTGDADMVFDHNTTAFPLTGAHLDVDCLQCHSSGFEGTPTDCAACHQMDHTNSVNPSHTNLGLSNDCISCHTIEPDWEPATFDIHDDFYPLNGAHALIANDCVTCHNGDYNNTPNTCVGCHQADYDNAMNPNHQASGFGTDCIECHSEDSWTPAMFDHDLQYFPIYSGSHEGEWNDCVDCHINPSNFAIFTCIGCHLNPETDDNHMGVGGYIYEDNACLACHPTGEANVIFDHNTTAFALTGAHTDVDCLQCHSSGFEGTPTDCAACHQMDHTNAVNPSHTNLGLSNDCISCHTTDPDWEPATFDIHDDYYPLNGAHALIANDCVTCHNGDYNNTPSTCIGCHQMEYDNTTNPNHQDSGFGTECIDCHNEDAWTPAMFDHDTQFFPIYSGSHEGEWNDCIDCHTDPNNFAVFTCIGCHINPETDDDHIGVGGYIYEDNACLSCHPTGDALGGINHDLTNFPLTGAHIGLDCLDCHSSGYQGTPTECVACHQMDYDNSANPNHQSLGLSSECIDCHTTDPGWEPATFDIHDNYYPLTGEHAVIANECALCHNGDYNNTPNTCVGCHQMDYDNSTNPDHQNLGIPISCDDCHTIEPDWMPATFDIHDNYYPLNGAHAVIANDCVLCHNGDYNNTPNTCVGCHQADFDGTTNPDHNDANFSTDCLDCHDESAWIPSTYDHSFYPLNGAHAPLDCNSCHSGGYMGTPNTCIGCHQADFDGAMNPDHASAGFPTDCLDCHNEDAWTPSTFDHDNMYFPIYSGKHEGEWNLCVDCHTVPSDFSVFSCIDCHEHNDQTEVDDDHQGVSGYIYESNACYSCHPTGEQ